MYRLFKDFFKKGQESTIIKTTFIVLAALSFFIGLCLIRDAGMSGDEHFHLQHASDVVNFYKTLGKDSSAAHIDLNDGRPIYMNEAMGIKLYGQLPDNLAFLIYNTFKIDDIMSVRHIVGFIFSWMAILFAALIVFRITNNWMASIITLILFFFSPHFLGHSFNNLKDPTLAGMIMMGIYYILRFFQTFPKPPKKIIIMLVVSIALSLATRIGGLLLIAYFGVFGFVYFIQQCWTLYKGKKKKEKKGKDIKALFWRLLGYGLGISLAGYIIGLLFWPYGLVSPITHVKETFSTTSQWGLTLRHVYEGVSIWSDSNPWYYLPKFILMTSPIAVLIGAFIYPFLGGVSPKNNFNTFIIYFSFIFPVFWIIYTGAHLYGGWRHISFMYPPMVAAGGLGYHALSEWISKKIKKSSTNIVHIFVLIGVIGMLYSPIRHIIKNHPYEYVYFNEIAGGTKKAYGQYELDYYYHSTRAASEWVIAHAEKSGLETGDKIKVVTWHAPSVSYFFRHDTAKFEVGFSRWYERGNNDWDYAIFVTTGINPAVLQNGTYPPANMVHTIDVDGVPIASILKRTDKKDYYGYLQMQKGNIDSAKILFKQSLEILPKNESVLTNLSSIYLQQGLFDSAIFYLNQFLAFEPYNENANYMAALSHYYKQDYTQALAYCKELSRNNPKSGNGHSLAANIYLQMNDAYSAEKELLKLMDAGAFDQNAANQLMNIYKSQGFNESVAQRKMFKHLAESFRKLGNIELAEQYEAASKK